MDRRRAQTRFLTARWPTHHFGCPIHRSLVIVAHPSFWVPHSSQPRDRGPPTILGAPSIAAPSRWVGSAPAKPYHPSCVCHAPPVFVMPLLCLSGHSCVCHAPPVFVRPLLCLSGHSCVCHATPVFVRPLLCLSCPSCVCHAPPVFVILSAAKNPRIGSRTCL